MVGSVYVIFFVIGIGIEKIVICRKMINLMVRFVGFYLVLNKLLIFFLVNSFNSIYRERWILVFYCK